MKKYVGIFLFAILIGTVSFSVFFKDFSAVTKAEYQLYNPSMEEFGEVKIIKDEAQLKSLIKSLNKAKHENTEYELVYHEALQVTLYYKDGDSETLKIWKDFGEDTYLIQSDSASGTYLLSSKESQDTLNELLS